MKGGEGLGVGVSRKGGYPSYLEKGNKTPSYETPSYEARKPLEVIGRPPNFSRTP